MHCCRERISVELSLCLLILVTLNWSALFGGVFFMRSYQLGLETLIDQSKMRPPVFNGYMEHLNEINERLFGKEVIRRSNFKSLKYSIHVTQKLSQIAASLSNTLDQFWLLVIALFINIKLILLKFLNCHFYT